jgi:hypothetical protein
MLVAADGTGGTALTAAGEIICPTTSKLYVVRNGSSYAVTLKTAAGTGIAVPTGQTAFLFCDGTNVNACVTTIVDGNISGNLTVNGNTTLGDANTDTVTVNARFNTDLLPSTDNARDLGSSGNSWKDLWIDGTATIATLNVTTTNATTVDTTNIEVTNIKAKDGTASATIADSTGVMTIASSVLTTTDINGGTIDGTVIGGASAAAGTFTTLNANGNVTLGDASTDTVTVNGYMGVGGAGTATAGIYVGSTALLGTSVFGIHSSPRSTTLNTTSLQSYYSVPITVASAHTVADVAGYRAADATKGAGSTITNQHGLRITDQTQGTNNYGITSLVSSGTDKWNIYAGGTAQNYFAGNVQFAAGSAAAPALTRFGDDNTGIFFPAADTLAASTAGSERLRITSAGNVGIGTSSPTNALSVTGNANVTGNVTLGDASTDTVTVNGYMVIGGGTPNSAYGLQLNNAALTGSLQIGGILVPTGSSAATSRIVGVYAAANTAAAVFTVTNVMAFQVGTVSKGAGSTITNQHGLYILDQTQGTNNFGITSLVSSGTNKWNIYASGTAANYFAGNVGIGIAVATANLEVARGSEGEYLRVGGDNATNARALRFTSSTGGASNGALHTINAASAEGAIALATAGTERLRITSAGNVGIGTTSPGARLNAELFSNGAAADVALISNGQGQASTNAGTAATLYLSGSTSGITRGTFISGVNVGGTVGGNNHALTFGVSAAGASPTERMRIDASGNLGLGVTPSAWSGFKALQVGGGNALMFTGANAYGQFYMLNNAYYNGSNYIYQYTQAAAMYAQNQGAHLWYTAPSGTAGNTITFTQAMTLDASGNLGIGTSLPSVKLQVYNNINGTPFAWGNAARTGYLYQDANGVGITNASGTGFDEGVYLDTANSKVVLYTNSTGRVTLDASGNLGLGVTPSAWDNTRAMQLGLSGSVYGDGQLVNWVSGQAMNAYGSLSGGVRVWKYISAQSAHRYEMGNGAAGSINGHAWYTAASGTAGNAITFTQAMTLDASGNLLVGGTTALKTATIRGTGLAIVGGPNQNVGNELYFYRSDNMPMGYIGWETPASANSPWTFDSLNGNAIRWAINSTERARIDSNGNLLVGTTTNPGGPGRIGINFDSSANFGISLKSTNVSDNGVYLRFFNSSNTSAGQIVQTAATTVSYATSSDYRLKNAIAPMTGALAKVALLKPCTYKWNADGSDGQGFIAHELAEVVPQCVTGEKDDVDAEGKPQYQGIDTSFLVATLTAAIQEQQAIIESLTARIAALESK